MKLQEFLVVCSGEDYVGIWNIDGDPTKKNKSRKRFEERPNEQQYFKIKNIPYGRICYFLDKDVLCINHTDKGFLVRISDRERTKQSLNNYDLAYKIASNLKG